MTTLRQWQRVKELVGAALEHEQSERTAFLDSVCLKDVQLRAEVESLIAAYELSPGLSAGFAGREWDLQSEQDSETPTHIGPYRLERELGVGGMGQVWLAEQVEPVHRYVALKLIRAGFRDPEFALRFVAEGQSLALMNHPSIAKVFDAGTTPAGQRYLVMEYIDGSPITDYCDRHKLPIHERLRLFHLVCEGVQHAHQKAIIHRDLKPSNILVTEVDGSPVPRIIDFGVAKALAPAPGEQALLTRVGSVLGTMGYMSPEQAEGRVEDIDTRSDVYSLGVVLYELLIGALPFDQQKLTYYEMLRLLREQDAPRPSTRLRESSTSLTVAHNRGTEPGSLFQRLRGDVDSITLKALEKDRNRRYASPADLAADITRYLQHEPVSAHSAAFTYLARKYVLRHRVGVVVATAAMLLLVSFAIAQTVQLRQTRRQRDRADRISQFMSGIFKVSNPNRAQGKTVTARDLLDNGAKQITTELKDDPELQARMMYQMADTYYNLGFYPQAQSLAQDALSIQRRVLGARHPDSLETMGFLGGLLSDEGHYKEAEKLQREQLELQERVSGPDNKTTLRTAWWLATTLSTEGRYAEAERLFRQTLAAQKRVLGPEHPETLMTMDGLANAVEREGHYSDAEQQYRSLVAISQRVMGPEHTNTVGAMSNLANTLLEQLRFSEAEQLYRSILPIQQRILGPDHPDTAITLANLGTTLNYQGRLDEAGSYLRQALAINERRLGPEHPYTLANKEALALLLSDAGDYQGAKAQLLQLIQVAGKADQPGAVANAWYGLACAAAATGHKEEAIAGLGKAVDHDLPSAQILTEPRLIGLHGDPGYEAVLARAEAAN